MVCEGRSEEMSSEAREEKDEPRRERKGVRRKEVN